ncbi:flagellar rod assembly protein FlgJ [Leclercia adecarboxylata]|nr:flagellar rod assembly protein FlgJ [Leclercia adecarboxylata]KMN61736.1 flagellar rod assembly protein FlgJ [Leclercia sp. LK8]
MNSNAILQGAAFDVHSLDPLKRAVKNNPHDGIKAAARQMEGLFVQMMLKSMRDASFKDGLFNSQQTEMFTSMYDQQISQNIADRGNMGLADMMVKQLGGQKPAVGYTHENILPQVPRTAGPIYPLAHFARGIQPGEPERRVGTTVSGSRKSDSFIMRLMQPALDAARKTGIPHQLIIAQAALESGWGSKEIPTQHGKPSHNLFSVKATPDWKGETTEITTTEYINGVAQKMKSAFRVYKSYAEALSDYTALLTTNPRYQNALNASSPEKIAHGLQAGGYATDPEYAKKLISIIKQVKGSVNQAVDSYTTDLSRIF